LLPGLPQGSGRLVPLDDQLLLAVGGLGPRLGDADLAGGARLGLLEAPLNGLERVGGALALPLQVLLERHDLGARPLFRLTSCGIYGALETPAPPTGVRPLAGLLVG
jgi:hypothetical protein